MNYGNKKIYSFQSMVGKKDLIKYNKPAAEKQPAVYIAE